MYWKTRRIYGTVATTLKKQQRMLKKQYDRSAHITKYIEGDYVALSLPLPPTERANNKFMSNLQTLYQIKRVVSDHNYLVERMQTGKRRVIQHDLLRFVSPELAKKLEGYPTNTDLDLGSKGLNLNTLVPRNQTGSTLKDEKESEDEDVILANVDVKELLKNLNSKQSKHNPSWSKQITPVQQQIP